MLLLNQLLCEKLATVLQAAPEVTYYRRWALKRSFERSRWVRMAVRVARQQDARDAVREAKRGVRHRLSIQFSPLVCCFVIKYYMCLLNVLFWY